MISGVAIKTPVLQLTSRCQQIGAFGDLIIKVFVVSNGTRCRYFHMTHCRRSGEWQWGPWNGCDCFSDTIGQLFAHQFDLIVSTVDELFVQNAWLQLLVWVRWVRCVRCGATVLMASTLILSWCCCWCLCRCGVAKATTKIRIWCAWGAFSCYSCTWN